MKAPISPNRRRELLDKLSEHLEAAQAITDELGEGMAGYLVERALDEVRTITWPHADSNVETFRRPPNRRPPGTDRSRR